MYYENQTSELFFDSVHIKMNLVNPDIINISYVQQPSATSLKQSVKDRLGPLLPANSEPLQDSSVASQVSVDDCEDLPFDIYLSKSAEGVYKHYAFLPTGAEPF